MSKQRIAFQTDIERGWKICTNSKCERKEEKLPLTEFFMHKDKNIYFCECKHCLYLRNKEYKEKHREELNRKHQEKRQNLEYKQKEIEYRDKNRNNINQKSKEKYRKDIETSRKRGRERYHADKYKLKNIKYREEYAKNNKDKALERGRRWRSAHKERLSLQRKERRKNDINFKIKSNLRARVCAAVRGYTKSKKTMELLGCTIEEFKKYLESKFQPGMTWKNYGKGDGKWHIDHIMPCAFFDLSYEESQRACFYYENMQPMWEEDNLSKNDMCPWGERARFKDDLI